MCVCVCVRVYSALKKKEILQCVTAKCRFTRMNLEDIMLSEISQSQKETGSLFFFLRFYLFLERGKKGEKERHIHVWLPLAHPLLGT